MTQFADYAAVHPTLNGWAQHNGSRWVTEYKGWNVKSYSWPLAGTESVQIWVDPPIENSITVNVALNSSSDERRKTKKADYNFENLEAGLDDALRIAREWKNAHAPNQ